MILPAMHRSIHPQAAVGLKPKPLSSRRAFLRGAGATLALPWLPSLAWAQGGKAAEYAKAPVRYGCLLFANGVNPHEWNAEGNGDSMKLSSSLMPLEPLKQHITVLKDLHVFNNTSGPHWPLFSNYLSGVQFKETLIPEGGESLDQVIARHTGRETPVPRDARAEPRARRGTRGERSARRRARRVLQHHFVVVEEHAHRAGGVSASCV